ncbi:MAG: nucleotidyltransferase domain-containing protein [Anaerolineales bacterium]|nr:nucleotidyltransferase domain-containing protein [Anaerolineales bacterium]
MKPVRLSDRDQQALRDFIAYLRASIPDQIESVTLFGSKARGDSKPGSDIDVLVILSQEDRALRREILKQAARFSLKYDVLLSPRVIGAQRWEQMRGFSIYQNVQQEAAGLDVIADELAVLPV